MAKREVGVAFGICRIVHYRSEERKTNTKANSSNRGAVCICATGQQKGNRVIVHSQRLGGWHEIYASRPLGARAAFGAVTLATSLPLSAVATEWDEAEKRRQPTPYCELGPFYKQKAANTSVLRAPGDAGMPLSLSGVVYNTRGDIVPNAKLEIWQTDNGGHYDIDGYRYRALLSPGPKGSYAVESVMPGHYPDRVCQHVHYLTTAPRHRPLITQHYFATDPVFEGNPDKNYTRDPLCTSRELVRPVVIKGDPKQIIAAVTFDLVMETL
jgi:protocatechuate 3,4-dioxygenase beta subunit